MASAARRGTTKALFVFGDSFADTGNHRPKATNLHQGFANITNEAWHNPYGCTFPGRPAGRFSDGLVVTDYIGMSVLRCYMSGVCLS